MSKMSLVVLLALAACLVPAAMSADTKPCEDDRIVTSVKKTIVSCSKDLTPYLRQRGLYALRVVERWGFTQECTLEMVPAIFDVVLEGSGKWGTDAERAVECVKTSLPSLGVKQGAVH